MGTYEFLLQFVAEHPFITFFIIFFGYHAINAPFEFGKRWLRSRDIQTHGWPIAPMDADGDTVEKDND